MSARDAAAAAFFKATNPDATEDLAAQTDFVREGAVIDAGRFLAALSAAGYAIVPVKPTFRMTSAGRVQANDERLYSDEMAKCVWSAMIAASQEEGK